MILSLIHKCLGDCLLPSLRDILAIAWLASQNKNKNMEEISKEAVDNKADCGPDCDPSCGPECGPECADHHCEPQNKDSTLAKTAGGLVAVALIFGAYAKFFSLIIYALS